MARQILFRRSAIVAACIAASIFLSGCPAKVGPTLSPGEVTRRMPRSWAGEFKWDDSPEIQVVEVQLEDSRIMDSNEVEFWGKGRYITDRVVPIDFRVRINPETLAVEIWESNPNVAGFVSNGSHRGHIDRELTRIEATWTSNENRHAGTLRLWAR